MMEDIRTILKNHQINATKSRLAILQFFLQTGEALTHNDFLRNPSHHLSRVTVFRTLQLFTQEGILHRIPGPEGLNRYLLKRVSSFATSSFICSNCRKIVPLEIEFYPKIELPEGFNQNSVEIIISGLCESCNLEKNTEA